MREADIAVQFARSDRHDLRVKRIGRVAYGLYAAHGYLERFGMPDFENGCAGHFTMSVMGDPDADKQAAWMGRLAPRAEAGLRTGSPRRFGRGVRCRRRDWRALPVFREIVRGVFAAFRRQCRHPSGHLAPRAQGSARHAAGPDSPRKHRSRRQVNVGIARPTKLATGVPCFLQTLSRNLQRTFSSVHHYVLVDDRPHCCAGSIDEDITWLVRPYAGDAPHLSPVTPSEDARTILINNVSWGAVLAGVATSLIAQLVLNMIGIGVGASTLNPVTGDNPTAGTFSMGAGLWWALSGVIAAFIGGYVASRLSGRPKESTGAWHGLITWAVTNLVIFYFLSTAVGGLVGGAFSTVSGALGGVGRTAMSAAQTAAPRPCQRLGPLRIDRPIRSFVDRQRSRGAARCGINSDACRRDWRRFEAADAREKAAQALSRSQTSRSKTRVHASQLTRSSIAKQPHRRSRRLRKQPTSPHAPSRMALLLGASRFCSAHLQLGSADASALSIRR